jgi:hypothetical protein
VLRRGACHLSGYGSRRCGVVRSRLGRLLDLVAELGLSGRVLAGCEGPGSVLFVRRLVGVVRGRCACSAHRGRQRRLPIGPPISRDREACHIQRLRS